MKRMISKLLIICMIVTMMPMRTIASEPPNELQLSSSNVINNVNTNSNESNYNKNIDNTSDMEIYNLCKSMDFTDEQIKNLISIYENPYYLFEQLKKYNILIEKNKGEKFTIEKLLFNKVDADEAEKIIANNNMANTLLIENKVLNDIKIQITTDSSIVIPENNLKEEDKNINIITTTGSSITTTTGAAIILYKDIDPKLNEELLGLCKNIQLDNEQIKKLVTFYENPNRLLEQLKIYNSLIQKYEEERNTLKQLLMKKTNGKDVEKNIIVSKALKISLESLYEKDTKALEKILSKEEQTLIEELIKEFSLDKEIWITLSNKLNKSIKQIAKEVREYKKNLTKDKTPVADSELLKWISNDVLRKMKEKYFIGNTCLEISKMLNEFKFKDKESIQLIDKYIDEDVLLMNLQQYKDYTVKQEVREEVIKKLLINGISFKRIEKGLFLRKALSVPVDLLYEDHQFTSDFNNEINKGVNEYVLNNLCDKYELNKETFYYLSYMLGKSIQEISDQIKKHEENPEIQQPIYLYNGQELVDTSKENVEEDLGYLLSRMSPKKYSEVNDDIITQAEQLYDTNRNDLEILEKNNLSLSESIRILLMEKQSTFNREEIINIYGLYKDFSIAEKEIVDYESFIKKNTLTESQIIKLKELIFDGKKMEEIIKAYDPSSKNGFNESLLSSRKKRSLNTVNSEVMSAYSGNDSSKSELKKYINAPFSVSVNQNEKVLPATGDLIYNKTLFTVPGKDNVNFNMNLIYNSAKSAQHIPSYDSNEKRNCRGQLNYDYQNFALGCGWSFNLSYIESKSGLIYNDPNYFMETAYRATNDEYKYLHLSDGRVLTLKKNEGSYNYSFEDKSIIDLKFEVCDTVAKRQEYYNGQSFKIDRYIQGRWDANPTYTLVHNNGVREFFNYDGKLLGVIDSNDNGYNVEYTILKEGDFEHIYPSKIRSTLGDEIKLIDIAPGLSWSVIEYADQVITLKKTLVDQAVVIDSVERKNKNNSSEVDITKFEYDCFYGDFSCSRSISSENNYYGLLKKIIYPTGAISEYQYIPDTLNVGSSGYFTIFKISDQKLKDKNKDCAQYKYNYSEDRTERVSVVNNRKNIYYHNSDKLLTTEEEYIKDKIVKKYDYAYNDKKLKIKSSKQVYNLDNNDSILYEEAFNYDDRGNLIEYTDVIGNKSNYTYDKIFNQVLSEEKPLNGQTRRKIIYERDNKGNVTKKILYDSNGNIETNFKNSSGEITNVTINKKDGSKYEKQIGYTNDFRPSPSPMYSWYRKKMSIANPNVSDYDPQTNTFKATRIKEEISYNPKTGDIIEHKDRNGNITKYEYDYRSRMIKQINPDGTYSQIIYDDINNVVMYIDENGFKIRSVYDGIGNLLRKEEFIGNTWQTKLENIYDNLMRVSQVKDANGNLTSYTYDDLDRVTKITYADGTYVQYIYDDVQNTKTIINEEGHSYKEYFDKLGRLIKKETNDGEKAIVIKNEYDYAGNLIKVIDANGNETKYVYDNLCRLIKTIDALGQETKYDYDELNQLVKISTLEYDPLVPGKVINEIIRTQEYDQMGRVIKKYDEDLKSTLFKYDGNGNIIWTKDKEGQIQTFNYNSVNKLSQHFFGNQKREYEYDPVGRVRKAKEFNDQNNTQNETTSYDYYEDGKLRIESLQDGKSTSYVYDAVGNITHLKDYFGNNISYNYDQRNRTKNIDFNGKVFSYEYYNDGMIKNVKYPNANLKTEYVYDLTNKIKTLNNMNLSSYSYKTDAASNIVEKNDNGNLFTYNYDGLNRIKGLVNKSKNEYHNYDYDVKSNIAKEEGDYSIYPEVMLGKYTWNPLGLVESFTTENGQIYNYKYNSKGLRNKKISNGEITSFYYLGNKLIGEEKNTSKTSYVRGNNILAKVVDGKFYYYFYNGHGDVVQITDEAGNVVNKYEYDEYGKIINKEEKMENSITYAGEYYDKESGNYYLKARYYNPQFRRFISRDSYEGNITNPLTMNLYSYCHNNPLRYIDPSGNTAEVVLAEEMGSAYDEGIVPIEAINSSDIKIETSSNIDGAAIQAQCSDDQVISKDIFDESIEAISETVGECKETWDQVNSPIGRLGEVLIAGMIINEIEQTQDLLNGKGDPLRLLETPKEVADHHLIPAFRGKSKSYGNFIKSRGINVDEYTITVSSGKHGQHMNFIHGKGQWNQKWMNFIDNNPNATAKDIFQFLGKMMDDYGLNGYQIHPYKK